MLSRIKALLRQYGYRLYTRPYELNIVGLRNDSVLSNAFDDEIHVFYRDNKGRWINHVYKATTDPGTYWLRNPAYTEGTAILPQGQYVHAYAIGKHRGLYDALVQIKPLTILRDYDRDAILDFNNGTRHHGLFGINIHRAARVGSTLLIEKYSAGCQVFQVAEDFSAFMQLCQRHAFLYGNAFTYTLIDFRSLRRVTWKRVLTAAAAFATVALSVPIINDSLEEGK